MSTDTTAAGIATVDTARPGIPMSRLVKVELRKLVDTRAGFWLVATMGIASAIIMIAMLIWAHDDDLTFGNMSGILNIPTGMLLPVLAILLVTSEWSQRTGLVTFTIEPRRARVVVAKFFTAILAAIGAVAAAYAIGAVGTVLAGIFHGGDAGSWDLTGAGLFNALLLQACGLFMGFAFAMLIMNSAAAIVLYFLLPTIWSIVANVVPWLREHLVDWLDFGTAQGPFQSGDWVTGKDWAHFAVAGTLWVVIPLIIGVWRLLRAEVK